MTATFSAISNSIMLVKVLALGSLALVIVIGLAWVFQERIAFQPPEGPWPGGGDADRVEYSAEDGQQLFAYLVGRDSTSTTLILAFHGNADLAVWQIPWAREVAERTGAVVMLAEYRGYAGLPGKPGYSESQRDAEAAYDYVIDTLGISPEQIVFFGHSMGSAVAAELAARHSPRALLLQSPFTSAHEMAGRITRLESPPFLWRLISRLHFNTVDRVAELDAPVFVAHGDEDRLIPPSMGRRIFDSAKHKGGWLLVPGAAHNDVAENGGEDYWNWITRAVKSG